MQFTQEHLQHFQQYEAIRRRGEFSMWDFQAQLASHLSQDRYFFVMKHYEQLRKQAETVT